MADCTRKLAPSRPTHTEPASKTGNQVLTGINGIRPNADELNLVPSVSIIVRFPPSAVAFLNTSLMRGPPHCLFLTIYLTNSIVLIAPMSEIRIGSVFFPKYKNRKSFSLS